MLPFKQRAGQTETNDAPTKTDNAIAAPKSAPPPPAPSYRPRPFQPSVSDEELTHLMPSKAVGEAVRAAINAAPVPAASSGPRSYRSPSLDGSEDEGRTAVRSAVPKIRKVVASSSRPSTDQELPTTISPAAVIKQGLEARFDSRNPRPALLKPPPSDLLAELADHAVSRRDEMPFSANVAPMPHSQPGAAPLYPHYPSGGFAPPPSTPFTAAQGSYPPPSSRSNMPGVYDATVSASSVGGVAVSAPAHFMVQGYSDARFETPPVTVTSRTKRGGRAASSWFVALLAVGLLVGVGSVAMMNRDASSLFETTASFVDPSRASKPAAKPAAAAAPVESEPAAMATEAPKVSVPAVAPAASPLPAEPQVEPAAKTEPAAKAESGAKSAKEEAKETKTVKAEPKPEPKPVAVAPKVQPAPRPAPAPVRAAPAPKPAPVEDAPVAAAEKAEKPAKASGKGAASKGPSAVDEETRKALETLQKSQLESSSF